MNTGQTSENIFTYTRKYSPKEYETISLKRQNIIFSIVAGSIWFVICFRLKILTKFHITLFN